MIDQLRRGVDRRTLLLGGGAALASAGAPTLGAPAAFERADLASQEIILAEGTNIAVAATPNGQRIAFDLLGVLWIVASEGGVARRLTDDFADIAQPDWSPDGETLCFQSYRTGNFHIWTIRADGSGLKQLTSGPYDHREPRFSPDGRRIAFSSDRSEGRYAIHILDLASGDIRLFSRGDTQDSEPAWSPDGRRIAYVAGGAKLIVADFDGVAETRLAIPRSTDLLRPSGLFAPSFAPDGGLLHVILADGETRLMNDSAVVVTGEDVFPFRASILPGGDLLYASNGKIRRLPLASGSARVIPFAASVTAASPSYDKRRRDFDSTAPRPVVGIGSPVLSPDGKRIAFRALNDIYVLEIGGDAAPVIRDGFHKCDPSWSPDGKWLAYSSDRAGVLDIWLRDLATGEDRQLTRRSDASFAANWSPDGASLAFLDQNGAVHTVEVATGETRMAHGPLWEPGRPSFGPDGRYIALAAFKPYSARYREGLNEILTIERATGKASYAPIAPHRSIATRGDDGPAWSPDGRHLAYVFASRLWIVPVDEQGRFAGEPRRLADEVADAPSWSGDSRTLLYLSNGKLRLVDIEGGPPRAVDLPLSWARATPAARTLVRVGRLWDGKGRDYRERVDILVDGNRVASLSPSTDAPPGDGDLRFFDASSRAAIPGLVDMHLHRQSHRFGDRFGRLLLAYGVTATRSPGGPSYHMVEDREAIEAGARLGPRLFGTGEPLDGSRIFYNFMRPVTEEGQLALELARARALSYDMIKTYVRLPHSAQAEIARIAQGWGRHVTSHYHYPALALGVDGVEHLGATSRFGYSRTISALGAGYADVTRLFGAARAARTPTLFHAWALLGEAPSIAEDERVRAFYPAWEQARLNALVKRLGEDRTARAVLFSFLERSVRQIRDTLDAGGRIVTGTDAPLDFSGLSLHLNLRAMVRFGVAPWEALSTATRFSGEFLEEPIGVIEQGALADFLLVDGDPLRRIEDAAAIDAIVANGVVHTPAALRAPFSGTNARKRMSCVAVDTAAQESDYWWHSAQFVAESRAACCCAGHFA